jgi:predicted DNA-binding protein with PD1-like motif
VLKPFLPLLVLGLLASPCYAQQAPTAMSPSSSLTAYALRLKPGDDLRQQLTAFVAAHHLEAGAVLTCVGSLTDVSLRLANQEEATRYHGHFEIVSLVGTLSASGGGHLHLAVADSTGRTLGGHLLDGCRIYTTAEIVLGALPALRFTREPDPTFGYQELVVKPAAPARPKKR